MNVVQEAKVPLLVRFGPGRGRGRTRGFATMRAVRPTRVAGIRYSFMPLDPHVEGARGGELRRALARAAPPAPTTPWSVAEPQEEAGDRLAWDLAYELADELGGGVFVEPDLLQEVPDERVPPETTPRVSRRARALRATVAAPAVLREGDKAKSYWPKDDRFAWHLLKSELERARRRVGPVAKRDAIRIAHLDTGYSATHGSRPQYILRALERNFVEQNRRFNAQDPGRTGLLRQPGHGTGTIGILAGGRIRVYDDRVRVAFDDWFGGAPYAAVVPVRIASSVIHIRTRTMPLGIRYAIAPRGEAANRCEVVTISMGGLPSQAWADAVNEAYEAGVAIFAAAGNRIGKSPPSSVVWPARFERVVAVCGVNSDGRPYYRSLNFLRMQGCFGPPSAMKTAIAAYTPNITWARLKDDGVIDLDGGGTSSATPQVAAAAALWLQYHRRNLAAYRKPWMQVEAVRRALFGSARPSRRVNSKKYFGHGILQAHTALACTPPRQIMQWTPPDTIHFPWFTLITGLDTGRSVPNMMALELQQLVESAPELLDYVGDTGRARPAKRVLKLLAGELSDSSRASARLRATMRRAYGSL